MRHQANPVPNLYTRSGARKYLTPAERARFLAAAQACPRPALRSLCLMLAYSGCRISEALALTPGSIETQGGFVAVRSLKKRGRGVLVREVPLPPELLTVLGETYEVAQAAPDTRLWSWSRSRAWHLVKGVMREAGIAQGPHATARGLRHGFGLHAIHSGVPLNLVQRWLGHARMETTAIYLQAMGAEERAIAARMWAADMAALSASGQTPLTGPTSGAGSAA